MIKIKSVGGQFLAKWTWTQWTNPVSALLPPCHEIICENGIRVAELCAAWVGQRRVTEASTVCSAPVG